MEYADSFNPEQSGSYAIPEQFDENNCLLIRISPDLVKSEAITIFAGNQDFSPKGEFHITIIGDKNIVSELTREIDLKDQQRKQEFTDKLSDLTRLLGPITLNDEYYLIKRETETDNGVEKRESIIQTANIEGIDEFYKEFTALTGILLGTPFPHVTLYTKGNMPTSSKGIGIPSLQVFNQLEHHKINM